MAGKEYARLIKNENFTESLHWKRRLVKTYRAIVEDILGGKFSGALLDVGCGNNAFVEAAKEAGLQGAGIDYDTLDLGKDAFPFPDASFDLLTANAVIEHIAMPAHFFAEVRRVLKAGGLILLTTPNWELSYRTFYNDPTHVRPYTRKGLTTQLRAHGFAVLFLEPNYICKPAIFWKLPFRFKIPLWTRSMLCVAVKQETV